MHAHDQLPEERQGHARDPDDAGDVRYAAQWEKQNHFTIEFLYNGGASQRFAVHGVDALLVATKPLAKDFYWVNHTWTHAYMGCTQDFFPNGNWKCATSNGQIEWAANSSLINSQIEQNFAWAKKEGIPFERGTVASGEYSGLKLLPQQPVDNPSLLQAMSVDHIHWIVLDASREPNMRPVGAALGVPGTRSTSARTSKPWPRRSASSTGTTTPRPTAAAGSARGARSRGASRRST